MNFNLNRFLNLVRIEIGPQFLMSMLIMGLIYFGITFLSILDFFFDGGKEKADIASTFIGVGLIGGVIMGSNSFVEIAKRNTRINYLNLPASASEKVISKGLVSIIVFPLLLFVMFFLLKGFYGLLSHLTNGQISVKSEFDMPLKYVIPLILATISVFFYGSVRFTEYAFPKTIFWIAGLVISVVAIGFVLAFLIFPELRQTIFGEPKIVNFDGEGVENHWIVSLLKMLFYLLPVIFVSLSIVCLKEKEG